MKKFLSFLVVACMTIACFPMLFVSADTNDYVVTNSTTATNYSSVQEAIDQASAGDYLFLVKNVNASETIEVKPKTGGALNKATQLDLNGYSLCGNGKDSVIQVDDGAFFKLLDNSAGTTGKVTQLSSGTGPQYGGGIYVQSGGTLSLNKGAYITGCKASVNGGGVYLSDGATCTFSGSDICVKGNSVNGKDNNIYLHANAELRISSAISNASIGITQDQAPVGGEQIGVISATYGIPNICNFFYDGEPYISTSTNAKTVVWLKAVCSTNKPEAYYASVAEAAASITQDYVVIDLLSDSVETEQIVIKYNYTQIDLNGHTLTGASGKSTILVESDAALTVVEASRDNKGTITQQSGVKLPDYGGAIYSKGTLNISNAQIVNCSAAISGGAIYVEDGYYFSLFNAKITNCSAGTSGGGIYSKKNVNVEKSAVVTSNTGANQKTDNICLASGCFIVPTSNLSGTIGVNMEDATNYPAVAGTQVGTVSRDYSGMDVIECDDNPLLVGEKDGNKVVWKVDRAWVHFDTDGKGSVADQAVKIGAKVTAPQAPDSASYYFEGWYKDSTLQTLWDFDTETITTETTIYAKWSTLVTVPSAVTGLVYDGTEQEGVPASSTSAYSIQSNKATDAGSYQATLTLASGYRWSDDKTTDTKEIPWSIEQATITEDMISQIPVQEFTGNKIEPSIEVKDGSTVLKAGDQEDYTVSFTNNVAPGTATLKVTGVNNYKGTADADFQIISSDVSKVEELILAIGTVEYTDECKAKIDKARSAYDALSEAKKGIVDSDLLKKLTDAEAQYAAMIPGEDGYTVNSGSWTKGSKDPLVIRGEGALKKFDHVEVDGVVLDSSNYELTEGSTIVTIKPAYLDTLGEGDHKIKMFWTDGTGSSVIKILLGKLDPTPTPAPGGDPTPTPTPAPGGDPTPTPTPAPGGDPTPTPTPTPDNSGNLIPKTGERIIRSGWPLIFGSACLVMVAFWVYLRKNAIDQE